MQAQEAIKLIRARVNDEFDTGYSDTILLDYINDAIKYLSSALIARNDPILVKDITVTASGTSVPKNFARFAGGYPIRKSGSMLQLVGGIPVAYARYFYIPDNISVNDSLPFDNDTYNMIIINLACVYALNQHEFNVQQDETQRQQLEQIIVQALGAIE